jgi:hypothetical protein
MNKQNFCKISFNNLEASNNLNKLFSTFNFDSDGLLRPIKYEFIQQKKG